MISKSAIKSAACLAVLAGLFIWFHKAVLLEGFAYVNLWIFRHHAPFPAPQPHELNALNTSSDYVTHHFAYRFFLARWFRAGVMPLWNPDIFCGFPLYANGSTALFSPFNALLLWMRPYAAYGVFLLVTFLAGGAAAFFYLLRGFASSRGAALAGALALVFCPFLMQYVDFQTLLGFVWCFPAALLAAELTARRRLAVQAAAAAGVFFAAALTSHFHVVLNGLALYVLYRLVVRPSGGFVRELPGTLLGSAAAVAASAFALAGPLEFALATQWAAPVEGAAFGLRVPLSPLTSVYPILEKLTLFHRLKAALPVEFNETPNLGFLPYLFAIAAMCLAMRRGSGIRLKFFAGLWALCFVLSCVSISGILHAFVTKWWQLYVFAGAVLCAAAFDALFTDPGFRRTLRRLSALHAALIVLPATAAAAALTFFSEPVKRLLVGAAESRGLIGNGAYEYERFFELFRFTRESLSLSSPFILIPAAGLAALWFVERRAEEGRMTGLKPIALKTALLGVLVIELFAQDARLRPVPVDPQSAYPQTSVTYFLQQDRSIFRTLSLQEKPEPGKTGPRLYVLKPNLGLVYGLADAGGQESVLDARYLYFAQKYLSGDPSAAFVNKGILDFEDFDANLASRLNIKYVVAPHGRAIDAPGWKAALRAPHENATVWINEKVSPRAYFSRRLRKVEDEKEIFAKLAAEPAGPEPVVYVSDGSPPLDPPDGGDPVPVEIVRHVPGDVRLKLKNADYGMLVLSDAWHAGWKATVDGQPAPVRRVDGLFKGVFLAPGEHEVRFAFRPGRLYAALAVSALTFAGFAAFFVTRRRRSPAV